MKDLDKTAKYLQDRQVALDKELLKIRSQQKMLNRLGELGVKSTDDVNNLIQRVDLTPSEKESMSSAETIKLRQRVEELERSQKRLLEDNQNRSLVQNVKKMVLDNPGKYEYLNRISDNDAVFVELIDLKKSYDKQNGTDIPLSQVAELQENRVRDTVFKLTGGEKGSKMDDIESPKDFFEQPKPVEAPEASKEEVPYANRKKYLTSVNGLDFADDNTPGKVNNTENVRELSEAEAFQRTVDKYFPQGT